MNSLLVSIALMVPMVGQTSAQTPRPKSDDKVQMEKLDGDWTVTYMESDGKKIEAKGTKVTIKNNVATCQHDGKEKSWHLEFGPHNMVRCTERTDGKTTADTTSEKRDPSDKSQHTHHGVYIASQEYFCLCMNKGRDQRIMQGRDGKEGSGQSGSTPRFGEQGAANAHFVLILQRSGTKSDSSR